MIPNHFIAIVAQTTSDAASLGRFDPTMLNFIALSFLLFAIGVAGVLTRRNVIVIFMSIELILNSVNLNLIAFSRFWQLKGTLTPNSGEVFAIFVIVVAAAEAAVGLAILVALYRNRNTVTVDEINLLKG